MMSMSEMKEGLNLVLPVLVHMSC